MKKLKYIGGVLLLLLAFVAGWTIKDWLLGSQITNMERKFAKLNEQAAIKYGDMQKKYRELEAAYVKEIAALDKRYQEKLKDAEKKSTNTIAALRIGTIQLRKRFQCPDVNSRLPEDNRNAGLDHGKTESGLRREDAEFLISEADRADKIVIQLQTCQQIIDVISSGK